MIKLFRFLKQKIKDVKLNLQLRKAEIDFNREVDSNVDFNTSIDPITIIEEETQQKYANGISNMKRALRSRANPGDMHTAFQGVDDLIELAKAESDKERKLREVRESILVYKGEDIKSAEDKEKMVDKRINMYYDLQKQKLMRQLARDIRHAKSNGDTELYDKLKKEWNDKYK